jgi:hypothetical protein
LVSVIDIETGNVYRSTMASKQTATRFDEDVIARLEAVLTRMAHVGRKPTHSDVVRAAVSAGLPTLEKAYGIPAPVDMSDPMKPGKRKAVGK